MKKKISQRHQRSVVSGATSASSAHGHVVGNRGHKTHVTEEVNSFGPRSTAASIIKSRNRKEVYTSDLKNILREIRSKRVLQTKKQEELSNLKDSQSSSSNNEDGLQAKIIAARNELVQIASDIRKLQNQESDLRCNEDSSNILGVTSKSDDLNASTGSDKSGSTRPTGGSGRASDGSTESNPSLQDVTDSPSSGTQSGDATTSPENRTPAL